MPTFYFNLGTGNRIEDDIFRIELPDLKAAEDEAMRAVRELFSQGSLPYELIITDDDRTLSRIRILR